MADRRISASTTFEPTAQVVPGVAKRAVAVEGGGTITSPVALEVGHPGVPPPSVALDDDRRVDQQASTRLPGAHGSGACAGSRAYRAGPSTPYSRRSSALDGGTNASWLRASISRRIKAKPATAGRRQLEVALLELLDGDQPAPSASSSAGTRVRTGTSAGDGEQRVAHGQHRQPRRSACVSTPSPRDAPARSDCGSAPTRHDDLEGVPAGSRSARGAPRPTGHPTAASARRAPPPSAAAPRCPDGWAARRPREPSSIHRPDDSSRLDPSPWSPRLDRLCAARTLRVGVAPTRRCRSSHLVRHGRHPANGV